MFQCRGIDELHTLVGAGKAEGAMAASNMLERRFGILVRAGLHCSPNLHRTLGTFPEGTVRIGPGPFTTMKQIAFFLSALRTISSPRR